MCRVKGFSDKKCKWIELAITSDCVNSLKWKQGTTEESQANFSNKEEMSLRMKIKMIK